MTKVHISELTARYDAGAAKAEVHGLQVQANIRMRANLREVEAELMRVKAALREARDISNSWKSSMEAWKDLAVTLKDEIKNCPNNDAHKFGKDVVAINDKLKETQNRYRNTYGLKPSKPSE